VDLLLIVNEAYGFCLLSYNEAKGELVTEAAGTVRPLLSLSLSVYLSFL
jgi:hypothetical protein